VYQKSHLFQQDKGRLFFFEKKNQKTFYWCRGPFVITYLKILNFFASFFQKRRSFFRVAFLETTKRSHHAWAMRGGCRQCWLGGGTRVRQLMGHCPLRERRLHSRKSGKNTNGKDQNEAWHGQPFNGGPTLLRAIKEWLTICRN